MRWRLIPPRAKDSTIRSKTFNARAETVADKPSFRHAFRRHRCLVPATASEEWQQEGRRKVSYQFRVSITAARTSTMPPYAMSKHSEVQVPR